MDKHLNKLSCVVNRLWFLDSIINSSDFRWLSADLNKFSFGWTINSIEEGNEFVESVFDDDDELVDEIDCLLLKIWLKVDLSCALF